MKTAPRVSVLMPAYNAEKYIGEAIESILNQTFKDFEFIIIDDASTDDTWKIIQEYAEKDKRIVPLHNEENLKIAETLNRGISITKGKYIARMDADDWSYPDRLGKQYLYMEENPTVGVSGGAMKVCDSGLNVLSLREYNLSDTEIRKKIFRYSPFSHPLVIFRASELKKQTGPYDPNFPCAQDYDLYFRIGKGARFGNLKDVLLKYRMLETGTSFSKARQQEQLTLKVRSKAVSEYGYSMTLGDRSYFAAQFLSMWVLSPRLKIRLFNFFRNTKT